MSIKLTRKRPYDCNTFFIFTNILQKPYKCSIFFIFTKRNPLELKWEKTGETEVINVVIKQIKLQIYFKISYSQTRKCCKGLQHFFSSTFGPPIRKRDVGWKSSLNRTNSIWTTSRIPSAPIMYPRRSTAMGKRVNYQNK